MDRKMKLRLMGDVYLVCGMLTLLTLFIIDCTRGNQFTVHLIGIILDIPALAYCIFRLYVDSHDYLTTPEFANSKFGGYWSAIKRGNLRLDRIG